MSSPLSHTVRLAMICALTTIATAACGGSSTNLSDPDTIVMGLIPNENAATLKAEYAPLADLVSKASGKRVQLEVMTNYAAVVEGQRAGTVHIAMYGPFSYVLAKDSGVDISPIAAELYKEGGTPSYHGYIVARADSGLKTLRDLRGKHICFVDPNSTSGRLYPLAGLLEAGIKPGSYKETFTGGHDASLLAVRDGDCDAAAIRDLLFEEVLPFQEDIDIKDYSILWKSPPVVNSPLAISNRLKPELRTAITTAILQRGNADSLGVDDIAGYWGFTKVEDKFYDPIRRICKLTKAEACRPRAD
ncbi:phosphate/phosphite/phosphonate ABC transporter substrate-binding protein [Spongiactinospora gelatinilytica]|uniref:Phosphate/phosphite/phosphonate ABC transporter substrate-binding protein n=1 Tax=Spongiactinospora gelatinilytica TaxID=2666298 RepID=A0A2W2H815_9ACTN|nr:phosphate/phosphite/phosphonate ABC transporter substrate-binding protein [Spongiactinospora gelatinilytica]PZG56662.1 phosphate/phosphite/phosphonate ABC transporter substrate-binding protein [Spongiactinospora gelatinilytica]